MIPQQRTNAEAKVLKKQCKLRRLRKTVAITPGVFPLQKTCLNYQLAG